MSFSDSKSVVCPINLEIPYPNNCEKCILKNTRSGRTVDGIRDPPKNWNAASEGKSPMLIYVTGEGVLYLGYYIGGSGEVQAGIHQPFYYRSHFHCSFVHICCDFLAEIPSIPMQNQPKTWRDFSSFFAGFSKNQGQVL